ncbi:MAG: DUF2189 domain-containing protein, partial [bacterium]
MMTVTLLAASIGPTMTGMASTFPVMLSVMAPFTHRVEGQAAVLSLLRGCIEGLVTFALFFSSGMPSLDSFLERVVSPEHWDFVATYFAVGGVFAAIVFAISVVSVPMMLDRGTDTVVAA